MQGLLNLGAVHHAFRLGQTFSLNLQVNLPEEVLAGLDDNVLEGPGVSFCGLRAPID